MKKTYSKPDVLFESFALNTNIAASCEERPDTNNENCGIKVGKSTVFVNGETDDCNSFVGSSNTKYDQYCYHVPESDLNIFFS